MVSNSVGQHDNEVALGDLGPLAWVLEELRKSLDSAVKSIRRFVRETEVATGAPDVGPLRTARHQLHQSVGALDMVGLPAPTKVLRAMESLAQKIYDNPVLATEDVANKLERAGFGLIEYLEGVLKGKNYSAVGLFPQYRAVLELAGAERIHPADLWAPVWQWLPVMLPLDAKPLEYSADLRRQMDLAVLRIVKMGDAASAQQMLQYCLGFAAAQKEPDVRIFWLICAGYFEAMALRLCGDDLYTKRAASRILQQYASLMKGDAALSERLAQDLVFFCSRAIPAPNQAPILSAVRMAYGLGDSKPVNYEVEQFGRTDPAQIALARKRIASAAETWSALAGGDANRLKMATEQFAAVSESLIKLQAESAELARALTHAIDTLVRQGSAPTPAVAMEVATALLYLEAFFEDWDLSDNHMLERGARLAQRLQHVLAGKDSEPLEQWMEDLYRRVSDRQTMGSVVDELRTTLADVEKCLDQFFRSPKDKSSLHEVPGQLAQMRGVLAVLGLEQPAIACLRMRASVEQLLVDEVDEASAKNGIFEKLGNSLSSLSFLIDMLSYQRTLAKKLFVYDEEAGEFKSLMGRERAAVVAPVVATPTAAVPSMAVLTPPAAAVTPPVAPVAPVVSPPLQKAAPSVPMVDVDADEDEDDLLGIFLEEAREVVQTGTESIVALSSQASDLEQQTILRRAFHTLKGSSRMVGLNEFGEAAWSFEQMLNALLAEQRAASSDFLKLVGSAMQAFGQWVDDIATHRDVPWSAQHFRQSSDAMRLHKQYVPLQTPMHLEAHEEPEIVQLPELQPELPVVQAQSLAMPEIALPEIEEPAAVAVPEPESEPLPTVLTDESFDFGDLSLPQPQTPSEPELVLEPEPEPILEREQLAMHEPEPLAEVLEPAVAEPDFAETALETEHIELSEFEPEMEPAPVAVPEPVLELEHPGMAEPELLAEALQPAVAEPDFAETALETEHIELSEFESEMESAYGAEPESLAEVESHMEPILESEQFVEPESVEEPELVAEDEPDYEDTKAIGDLRLSIPLYNIYLNEADEWSRQLQIELNEWSLELPAPLPDSVVALAHSLSGSSSTVGFHALFTEARALEHALEHVRLHQVSDAGHARVFNDAAEDIRRLLHQFAAGFLKDADLGIVQALQEIAAAEFAPHESHGLISENVEETEAPSIEQSTGQIADDVLVAVSEHESNPEPEHLALPANVLPAAPIEAIPAQDEEIDAVDHFDPDLLPVFQEEAQELMPLLGTALRQWVEHPANSQARSEVLRHLHTIKGSARLAGALRMGEMAHHLESSIEHLGGVTPQSEQLEPLLLRFDALQAVFDSIGQESAELVEPLEPTESIGATAEPVELAPPTPSARPEFKAPAPVAPTISRGSGQQSVRVRSQLLDRLVNQAGEVMITRSRMEVRVKQLRASMQELGGNLDRLRQQLRDVELQAESQMQSRLAQTKETTQGFDPLEFDRFTRVQELTRMMAESVNDVGTVHRNLQRAIEGTEDDLIAQARQSRELQRDLLRTRMVEFEAISERLYGVVRQASKEAGKQVKLDIVGGTIEMDRGVLDRMAPTFEHVLRNAVGHGIESAEQRAQAGKSAAGQIQISVRQEGNDVYVAFRDDGAGLHLEKIRAKAIAKGLIGAEDVLSEDDAANLIFMPGFSTADQLTELSGRGIGMDVVRSEVQALGGRIETSTTLGQGTTFKLILPLTTAVTQVVMLRMGQFTIGVPANLMERVLRVPQAQLEQAYQDHAFTVDANTVPFYWAGALLQISARSAEAQGKTLPVAVFRSAGQRLAVHIDEVLGNREVVVKNLGPQLSRLPGLAGMSVLASGAVVLIYNPVALGTVYGERVRAMEQAQPDGAPVTDADQAVITPLPTAAARLPLVMVVDDSITVRRVTQRLLKREGYRVVLASDGLDALEKLQDELPRVVLSDIEMPRMDGFDLARNIRGHKRLHDLPIIMITSRIAEKHREHAMELGVNHYLGKPYSEDELLGLVRSYCEEAVVE